MWLSFVNLYDALSFHCQTYIQACYKCPWFVEHKPSIQDIVKFFSLYCLSHFNIWVQRKVIFDHRGQLNIIAIQTLASETWEITTHSALKVSFSSSLRMMEFQFYHGHVTKRLKYTQGAEKRSFWKYSWKVLLVVFLIVSQKMWCLSESMKLNAQWTFSISTLAAILSNIQPFQKWNSIYQDLSV